MDIQFCGANCLLFAGRQKRVVIDDNLADLGAKSITREGDVALFTSSHADPAQQPKLIVDRPGEYEIGDISIYGIAARAHIDEPGQQNATMYKILIDDLTILVTGHIYPELNDGQLENIGMVDIMFVPVGNNGYTLDGVDALKLIKKIEPKLVVPTHYDDPKLHFPVTQHSLDQAIHDLAMEPKETVAKLRIKPTDLSDTTQLVVLQRS